MQDEESTEITISKKHLLHRAMILLRLSTSVFSESLIWKLMVLMRIEVNECIDSLFGSRSMAIVLLSVITALSGQAEHSPVRLAMLPCLHRGCLC